MIVHPFFMKMDALSLLVVDLIHRGYNESTKIKGV